MPTEYNQDLFGFAPVGRREVVGSFDGGSITSDAGALLLRRTDQVIGLSERLAARFHDRRYRELVEHSVETLVGQRVFGITLGAKGRPFGREKRTEQARNYHFQRIF
jgi:Transposase DDE domain group 1